MGVYTSRTARERTPCCFKDSVECREGNVVSCRVNCHYHFKRHLKKSWFVLWFWTSTKTTKALCCRQSQRKFRWLRGSRHAADTLDRDWAFLAQPGNPAEQRRARKNGLCWVSAFFFPVAVCKIESRRSTDSIYAVASHIRNWTHWTHCLLNLHGFNLGQGVDPQSSKSKPSIDLVELPRLAVNFKSMHKGGKGSNQRSQRSQRSRFFRLRCAPATQAASSRHILKSHCTHIEHIAFTLTSLTYDLTDGELRLYCVDHGDLFLLDTQCWGS